MYQVKERGRNGFRFYTKEMDQQARQRLHLEHELRHAIARDELELYFQPIVTCSDKRIMAAEALLRWRPAGGELRSAAEFIPVAEESGLVVPIGEWVLAKACAQAKAWSDAGMGIRVDVNLSPRQLYLSGIAKTIGKLLAESKCDPSHLGLEITETAMMNDMEVATRTILELKSLGIHISVDDFGMGYSSLSYLKRFPINRLKIDRAFVSGAESDSRDAALTTAIIAMAHSMELTATAEGVETAAQATFLTNHNCDELQGYYFGRPVPATEFSKAFVASSGRATAWH